MNKKIIIYLGDETHKQEVICNVLDAIKIPYQLLNDLDLYQTIGYLMDIEGFIKSDVSKMPLHLSSDLMIFHNVKDQEIHALNLYLKEQQIEMKRKAIVTEHNQKWLLKDLLIEIEKEHAWFGVAEEIHKLLQASSTLVITDYTSDSWSVYEKAFYQAYEATQKESSIDELKAYLTRFSNAKEALKKSINHDR